MSKQIVVLAATDLYTLEFKGADVEETHCETIGEAKTRAKYLLSKDYQTFAYISVQLGYSRVLVNGKCVADYDRHN